MKKMLPLISHPSSHQPYPVMMHIRKIAAATLATAVVACALQAAGVAPDPVLHKQRHFRKTIPAGNYSGITWIGGQRYAVVDDKSPTAGFHLMTIVTDSLTGQLLEARADTFLTCGMPNRDEEGICYVRESNTLFVAGEKDNEVIEYTLAGRLTGRRLEVPAVFKESYANRGLEALTYNARTRLFWTTSESTLQADGPLPTLSDRAACRLRLQSFDGSLQPYSQYWYETDCSVVKAKKRKGTSVIGVSGLAALDDGRLVVMEREVRITPRKIGSFVHVRLYVVDPSAQQPGSLLHKTLLMQFRTRIHLTARSFANYEGICVGPALPDGRQVLVLLSDSQARYRGFLKDWFRTLVL